jgi:hypothetical protein
MSSLNNGFCQIEKIRLLARIPGFFNGVFLSEGLDS